MTNATETLRNNIMLYSKNPTSVNAVALALLEDILEDKDIVSAESPFMFLLEVSATGIAAAIAKSESITRRLYPLLANTESDLYRHMSDKDYIGRFSSPAVSSVQLLLDLEELEPSLVTLQAGSTVKSLIIPRDTKYTVLGLTLTGDYPIRIDLMPQGNYVVSYDVSELSPFGSTPSSLLVTSTALLNGSKYLSIKIPVKQYNNTSTTYPLDDTADFKETLGFKDKFFHCRVYIDYKNNEWVEIKTTHNNQVYDINTPTAVLEVIDSKLHVQIPDIYTSTNQLGNTIRVDIFTTKGDITFDISDLPPKDFAANWSTLDTYADLTAHSPLNDITNMLIYSLDVLTGGSDSRTLKETKDLVVYRVDTTAVPIRESDIHVGLQVKGYTVLKIIDSITDRLYLASKDLPLRVRDSLSSTIFATNAHVTFDPLSGDVGGDSLLSIRVNNLSRTTILPNTLYVFENNLLRHLTDVELVNLESLTPKDLVATLNSKTYLYSPFHYVIDNSTGVFNCRTYYMTNPIIGDRSLLSNNLLVSYGINTTSVEFTELDGVYTLIIKASIPSGLTGLHVQIRFTSVTGDAAGYLNGTVTLGATELTATFLLGTTFDVDEKDNIEITTMHNSSGVLNPVYVSLKSTFELFYLVSGDPTGLSTDFDDKFSTIDIVGDVIAATHESLELTFGERLDGLYTDVKNILRTGVPSVYTAMVPATYLEDVYDQSGIYGTAYTIVADDVVFTLLHSAGDPILDGNSDPVPLHNAGDPILDINGDVIPVAGDTNRLLNQIGITMIDALYRYATTEESKEYNKLIPQQILNYLTGDIIPAGRELHERTELYYRPKGSLQKVPVAVGDGVDIYVDPNLLINITFFIDELTFNDSEVRHQIESMARNLISKYLTNVTISVAGLTDVLLEINGDQIRGIDVSRFNDDSTIMTLLEPGTSFGIKEEMRQLTDGTLDVVDTIDIKFKTFK